MCVKNDVCTAFGCLGRISPCLGGKEETVPFVRLMVNGLKSEKLILTLSERRLEIDENIRTVLLFFFFWRRVFPRKKRPAVIGNQGGSDLPKRGKVH